MKGERKKLFKIYPIIICILLCSLFYFDFSGYSAYAESANNESQLQQIKDTAFKELKKAKTPKAAIGVIQGTASDYILYSNKDNASINENAIFQLGSVSKAFTALGVLLLEDEGLISLSDPVSKHLPWFKVNFNGQQVDDKELSVANLIYQMSGFTNDETKYPAATNGMTLEESVRQNSGKKIAFYPSSQFAYSNVNYRALGLILEVVSGQSYEKFITERILKPLGLTSTYADLLSLPSEKIIVKGSKLSFFNTFDYDIPAEQGNVPAGYIYSSLADVCRWAQIQMGVIKVSEKFDRIIEASHEPNKNSVVDANTNYAAGWFVNSKTNEVYHSGGTANYSTNISMRKGSKIAACVLTNMNASANTNNVATNVLNILEGQPILAYQADIWMVFDIIFSLITIIGSVGITAIIFFVVRNILQIRSGKRKKSKFTAKNLLLLIPSAILTVFTIAIAVVVPMVFASTWTDIGIWSPYSLLWGMGVLAIATVLLIGLSIISVIFKKNAVRRRTFPCLKEC